MPVDDAPAAEPTSATDGNDDASTGDDATGDDDAPATTDESQDDGDGGLGDDQGDGAPRSAWDQTPEERRAKRFNDLHEHSNKQRKELEELRAFRKEREAAEKATPETPAAPKRTSETVFNEALDPAMDFGKLSENQRQIRHIDVEVRNYFKSAVEPAQAKVAEATTAVTTAGKKLERNQNALEVLRERDKGRGVYTDEIEDLERDIRDAKTDFVEAKQALTAAKMDHRDAEQAWKDKASQGRTRAFELAKADEKTHHQTASKAENDRLYQAEKARIDDVWTSTVDAVIKEMKLPADLRDDLFDLAYRRVEAENARRGGKNPVQETEFKTLATAALKNMSRLANAQAGKTEAEAADVRAAATDQPTPKKRVANKGGDAKPQSVEEAEAALRQAFKGSRIRSAA